MIPDIVVQSRFDGNRKTTFSTRCQLIDTRAVCFKLRVFGNQRIHLTTQAALQHHQSATALLQTCKVVFPAVFFFAQNKRQNTIGILLFGVELGVVAPLPLLNGVLNSGVCQHILDRHSATFHLIDEFRKRCYFALCMLDITVDLIDLVAYRFKLIEQSQKQCIICACFLFSFFCFVTLEDSLGNQDTAA